MKYLIFIALGGASGAVSRYLLANWAHQLWEGKLPVGTLLVNLLGSAAIGVVYVLLVEKEVLHPDWRGVLMVGFLGAFTTFSTFAYENHVFLKSGDFTSFALYTIGSFIVAFLAVFAGLFIAKSF